MTLQLDKARESLRDDGHVERAAGHLIAAVVSLGPPGAQQHLLKPVFEEVSDGLNQAAFRCEQSYEFGGLIRLLAVIYAVNPNPAILKQLFTRLMTTTQREATATVARLLRDQTPELCVEAAYANFRLFLVGDAPGTSAR